jgi:2-polyprenyl-3-methyl-5-hydroxy-6-metoxy-1,4-benzoquinol methylase
MSDETTTGVLTQLRVDVGRIEGILTTRVVVQGEEIQKLSSGHDALNEKINTVNTKAETNTTQINNLQGIVNGIQEKQNGSAGKVALVVSLILSFFGLLWQIVSKGIGG